jgi:hypothetical protein
MFAQVSGRHPVRVIWAAASCMPACSWARCTVRRLHHAPVAVVGTLPLGAVVSRHGGGAIRLVPEPSAEEARAAIRGGQAYAAILAGRHGESLVIEAAASPGTAAALTKGFTTAAAAIKIPLQVRDVAPLPASDPTGVSVFFLIIAWTLGGYIGATVIATAQLMVSSGLRHVAIRLALLAGYAAVFGLGVPALSFPGIGGSGAEVLLPAGLGSCTGLYVAVRGIGGGGAGAHVHMADSVAGTNIIQRRLCRSGAMWRCRQEGAVKPSAQPTLVRTQHLPHVSAAQSR